MRKMSIEELKSMSIEQLIDLKRKLETKFGIASVSGYSGLDSLYEIEEKEQTENAVLHIIELIRKAIIKCSKDENISYDEIIIEPCFDYYYPCSSIEEIDGIEHRSDPLNDYVIISISDEFSVSAEENAKKYYFVDDIDHEMPALTYFTISLEKFKKITQGLGIVLEGIDNSKSMAEEVRDQVWGRHLIRTKLVYDKNINKDLKEIDDGDEPKGGSPISI